MEFKKFRKELADNLKNIRKPKESENEVENNTRKKVAQEVLGQAKNTQNYRQAKTEKVLDNSIKKAENIRDIKGFRDNPEMIVGLVNKKGFLSKFNNNHDDIVYQASTLEDKYFDQLDLDNLVDNIYFQAKNEKFDTYYLSGLLDRLVKRDRDDLALKMAYASYDTVGAGGNSPDKSEGLLKVAKAFKSKNDFNSLRKLIESKEFKDLSGKYWLEKDFGSGGWGNPKSLGHTIENTKDEISKIYIEQAKEKIGDEILQFLKRPDKEKFYFVENPEKNKISVIDRIIGNYLNFSTYADIKSSIYKDVAYKLAKEGFIEESGLLLARS